MVRFGNTPARLRKIRVGMPLRFRAWVRWWEPIKDILDNASSGDMNEDYRDDVIEWAFDTEEGRAFQQAHGIPRYPKYADFPRGLHPTRNFQMTDYDAYDAATQEWERKYFGAIEEASPVRRREVFKRMLDDKREDWGYPDVVESVDAYGFLRPLTVRRPDEGEPSEYGYVFEDGHHRLAAAIDLGYSHVPVQLVPKGKSAIADDSGGWDSRRPIAVSHRQATRR